jgi:hypothetical protein
MPIFLADSVLVWLSSIKRDEATSVLASERAKLKIEGLGLCVPALSEVMIP